MATVALAAMVTMALPGMLAARPRESAGPVLALPALETWALDNGMQVAFLRVDTAPAVAVEVWYRVGSKDEPRNRRGLAHMFEHMMFEGTERVRPEEHARYIERLGGYVNAATSEDATWYIDVLPGAHLDFAMRLEAERMRSLLFRTDTIRSEREVVKEEIRQQENNPLAKGFLRFLEIAYTRHPYAWTAAGRIADLDAATAEDLRRFYDTYYVPNNALLVVVGSVTAEQVRAAAETWFGRIPRGPVPPRPADAAAEPAQTGMRREVAASGQLGLILGGYHIPAAPHDDIPALQIAALVLGAGDTSRLTQRLVRKDGIAAQAGAPLLVREHPGLFAFYAVYRDPDQGPAVEAALRDEVAALGRTGPRPAELRKARKQLQAAVVFRLEDIAGIAQEIGSSWVLTGEPDRWLHDLERYQAVTAADVRRVAGTYLVEDNLTVVVIPPAGAAAQPR